MSELCDILQASYSSASVMNHTLCEYGDGSMGGGLRKLAGEMIFVGSEKGYSEGFFNGYSYGFNRGEIKGSIITMASMCTFAGGIYIIKKLNKYYKEKNNWKNQIIKEEENEDGKENDCNFVGDNC